MRHHPAIWFLVTMLIVMGCGGGKPRAIVGGTPMPRTGPGYARVTPFEPGTRPGVMQTGMKGDWLLENDQMRVVVSGTGPRLGGGRQAGNIIDAAPFGGEDLLRSIQAFFDPVSGRQAIYSRVASSGSAAVIAEGVDSPGGTLGVITTYSLVPNASFVAIRTTLVNRGTEVVRSLELADRIEWGRATAFGPGIGKALAGKRPLLPFLLGYSEGTAYAWVSQEADLSGTHTEYTSSPVIRTVDLAPGDSVSYTRKLYVTASAAFASSAAWVDRNYADLGTLRLTVEGKGDRGVEGGTVEIWKHDGAPLLTGELSGRPDDWMLPEGEVVVHVRHPERGAASSVKVSVHAGRTREVNLHLPQPALLSFRSIDGSGQLLPARWTFEGIGDTPTPEFGPRYDIEGAGNYHFTPRGSKQVRVPPGRYQITATRGPAYQIWRTEISLHSGKETSLEARLVHLEIPPAWVAADLHVLAAPTGDAPVDLDDRALELACEGIEWFVSGDPWHRTSYADILDTLRVAAPLHAIVGEGVIPNEGRFQVFPVPVLPDRAGNGALDGETLSLDMMFDRLHSEGEDVLIQVEEPRAIPDGYFERYGYTSKVDTARVGFRRDFDLLEVLSGKSNPRFPALWEDWMRLLGGDSPVTAVGNSDSRSLHGDDAGVPRNYVALEPSTEQEPLAKFLDGVRMGRVVVSNGPFIDFTLEGVGVGGTVVGRGTLRGHIRVVAPSWVDVKRVRVFLNGREDSSYMTRGRNRTVRFDEDIEITVNSPSFVVVRVEGDEPMDPMITASGSRAGPRPIAFTNPIWVKTEGGR